MSSQEREIMVSLISAIICFAIYLYYMGGYYDAGEFFNENANELIGKSVFYLVGLSVVVTIVLTILMAIVNNIITGENEKDLVDERDRLISLRGMQISFITFSAGFLLVMAGMAWFDVQPIMVIFYLICIMYFCALTGDLAKLYHYRRGV